MLTLSSLPVELLDAILSHVPPEHLQHTARALSIAFPRAEVSTKWLWRHTKVTREGQAWEIIRAMKGSQVLKTVQSVNVQAWREDPQMLVNLCLPFPAIRKLQMTVGPLFAPEHLEELFETPVWRRTIESVALRFNPYVFERSYYTFLKGSYFDSLIMVLSRWPSSSAPHFRRLSFVQDLPPTHGEAASETPVAGLPVQVSADGEDGADSVVTLKKGKDKTEGKLAFAQPIVFFKLICLVSLAFSHVGAHLTSLTFRLPRRSVMSSLIMSSPAGIPFPALRQLDLSTTHMPQSSTSVHLPLFLATYPKLQYLILDRCTGLARPKEADEPAVMQTMRWVGKSIGGSGAKRADEAGKAWRRLLKQREEALANTLRDGDEAAVTTGERRRRAGRSGFASMPRQRISPMPSTSAAPAEAAQVQQLPPIIVKEVIVLPSPSSLRNVGLGLFDLKASTARAWQTNLQEGYEEAMRKAAAKIETWANRWDDKALHQDRAWRLVAFRDSVEEYAFTVPAEEGDEDHAFAAFCKSHDLVAITPSTALDLLEDVEAASCSFCLVPDCSDAPGVPHLSSLYNGAKETKQEREAREKTVWAEEDGRNERHWQDNRKRHAAGCAHLERRRDWDEL